MNVVIRLSIIPVIFLMSCSLNTEKSERLVEEGLNMTERSRFKDAIPLFTEAIAVYPENFEAYYHRGNCQMNLRNYEEAVADYSEAIAIHPDYADAYANRGQAKFYLNDRAGACDDWKQATLLGKPNLEDKTRHCK